MSTINAVWLVHVYDTDLNKYMAPLKYELLGSMASYETILNPERLCQNKLFNRLFDMNKQVYFSFSQCRCMSFLAVPWQSITNWMVKTTEIILSQFWRLKVWSQGVSRTMLSLKTLQKDSSCFFLTSHESYQPSLVFIGLHLHSPNLCFHQHMALFLSVSLYPLLLL